MNLPVSDDGKLNGYLDEMVRESQLATKDYVKEWEENLKFFRGRQWQEKLVSYRQAFTANVTKKNIKSLVGLMTDTRPSIEVHSKIPGMQEMIKNVLTPAIQANWDEQGYDQKLAGSILPVSMIMGMCAVDVCYDPSLDNGRGDVTLGVINPRSLIIDPTVTRPENIEYADYVGHQTILSIAQLSRMFPGIGGAVQPDSSVSRFLDQQTPASGFESPTRILGRAIKNGAIESTVLSRASVQTFFINDHRLVKELPTALQEVAHKNGLTNDDEAWPGSRRIVRAGSNKIILKDHANPYIDHRKPYELFDWGLETENVWGDSEVAQIKSLQSILNKLGSAITENAIKMNNNIWIGDKDALEKNEWKLLNDAPGLIVKVKPNRQLRREAAPALPGSVFQMIQWIVNIIDTLNGLTDAVQGRRPVGIVSGHAIEALQLSAQVLVRLQNKKLEAFLNRIGQKLIARIFQFFTTDRMMHIVGRNGKIREFKFERDRLVNLQVERENGKLVSVGQEGFRDLTFRVTPGSGMAISRVQKGQMALGLFQLGLIPSVQVLQQLEWDDPEYAIEEARREKLMGLQNIGQEPPTKRARIAA